MRQLRVLLLLVCCVACKPKIDTYPLDYPEEKMVRLLVDLHTAEAMVGRFKVRERDSVRRIFVSRVYHIHDVTRFQIDSMMKIIDANQYAAQALQKKVVNRLRHIEEKLIPKIGDTKQDTTASEE